MTVFTSLIALGIGALLMLIHWGMIRMADRLARSPQKIKGKGFDVSPLHLEIENVRADFAAQSSLRNLNSPYHDHLLEAASEAISKMAFFQSKSRN